MEFTHPPLDISMQQYMAMANSLRHLPAACGFVISLGHKFIMEGVSDADERLLTRLHQQIVNGITPRVLPSYAIGQVETESGK